MSDIAGMRLTTKVVLKKFAGDDQTQEPVEVIEIEDGVIVSHERKS